MMDFRSFFLGKLTIERVDESARIVRLIITVVSFKNFLKIGTPWASSKRNKLF